MYSLGEGDIVQVNKLKGNWAMLAGDYWVRLENIQPYIEEDASGEVVNIFIEMTKGWQGNGHS